MTSVDARHLWRVAATIALLAVAGCRQPKESKSRIKDRLKQVEAWMIPARAKVLSRSGPRTDGLSIRSDWVFETRERRDGYLAWARSNLTPEFNHRIIGSEPVFGRYKDGDSETLTLKTSSHGEILDVRAAYVVMPD